MAFDAISSLVAVSVSFIVGFAVNEAFRRWQYSKKPILKISNKIIKTEQDGCPVLRAKLINLTKNAIVDVKIIFYGIEYLDSDKKLKRIRPLAQYDIPYIKEFNEKDKQSDYAYHTSMKPIDLSDNVHNEMEKFELYMILVKATNTYSGSISAVYHYYEKDAILDHSWHFETGNTTNAQQRKDVKDMPAYKSPEKDKIKMLTDNCPLFNTKKDIF